MAITADISSIEDTASEETRGERAFAPEPAIDLVHLSHQTLGDNALETELLALFDRQMQQIAARLAGPPRAGENKQRGDLAHMLRGSACAIGAFGLARAAADYESAVRNDAKDRAFEFQALEKAIDGTRAAVAALLERK